MLDLVRALVPGEPRPVRAVYFNKAAGMNWMVSWHQDLTIAVREPADVPGFGPWSVKDGIPHVQAPAEVLEQMIALRLHLDDTDESNGALRVLPGTHRLGRLSAEDISALRRTSRQVVCGAAGGDVLLMRPLLLHASSRSRVERPRRVLHLEYAGCELPRPLEWNDLA